MNRLDSINSTLLLGPGPSTVSPNVYKALSTTTIGHCKGPCNKPNCPHFR